MGNNLPLYLGMVSVFAAGQIGYPVRIVLDFRDAYLQKRHINNKIAYHILLGLWPYLTMLLLVLFIEKSQGVVAPLFMVVTGLLYLILGLWDMRSTLLTMVRWRETPITSWALMRYSLVSCMMAASCGLGAVVFGCLFLVVVLYAFSEDMRALLACLALAVFFGSGFLLYRAFERWWSQQKKEYMRRYREAKQRNT